MSERSNSFADNWAIWFLIAFFVVVLIGIVVGIITSEPVWRVRRDCIKAGYLGYELIDRTLVCKGTQDGKYVVEPLDDVRARLEGR